LTGPLMGDPAGIKQRPHDFRIGQIADHHLNFSARVLMPDFGPLRQRGNSIQHAHVQFRAGISAKIVVHNGHIITAFGKKHGSGPAKIPVSAKNQNMGAFPGKPTLGKVI